MEITETEMAGLVCLCVSSTCEFVLSAMQSVGSGFNLAQFPPTTPFTASSSPAQSSQQQMMSSSLKRLTNRIESFFGMKSVLLQLFPLLLSLFNAGSVDRFSSSVVSTSRYIQILNTYAHTPNLLTMHTYAHFQDPGGAFFELSIHCVQSTMPSVSLLLS